MQHRTAGVGSTEAGARPLLEIVIVATTGLGSLLRDCLHSLERHPLTPGHSKLWLVDNASEDGLPEIADCRLAALERLRQPVHLSFAAANNTVLRRAVAPYVLLLNPDTEVTEGALDRALEVIEGDADLGVLGVRLVRRDGSFDHAAKRRFPTLLGAIGHFSGVGRVGAARGRLAQYRAPELDEHGRGEVDAVNGAFMLVRRAAMEGVGLLDEGYRFYGEDLDWCYRFKQSGWKVWYEGTITVVHVKGGTTLARTGGTHRRLALNFAFHHAMGRFYRKFHAGHDPVVDAGVYVALWAKFLVSASRSAFARRSLF